MLKNILYIIIFIIGATFFAIPKPIYASTGHDVKKEVNFPKSSESYNDSNMENIKNILIHRIKEEPFNIVATLIFFAAIIHSFLCSWFISISKKWQKEHYKKKLAGEVDKHSMHMGASLFHFLGEIEAVFGIWAIVLGIAITIFYDWNTFVYYVGYKLEYTEPMFLVVIMTIAASRPILKLFELMLWKVVKLMGGTLEAWWLVILTVGPLLGSFITEPAAMTISAYLLADKFFDLNPSKKMKYATLAILFVNVSVGGTLSNFAAPPILIVAGKWDWDFMFMISNFGWKAVLGIVIINTGYFFLFKKDLNGLKEAYAENRFRRYVQRRFMNRYELAETPLMIISTILTSFNDNAAITYLSTLVTGFSDGMKYAVVAGAVTGGGLTIIANAPNPAGQSILKKYFKHGISPVLLLKSAIIPTLIVGACFFILH